MHHLFLISNYYYQILIYLIFKHIRKQRSGLSFSFKLSEVLFLINLVVKVLFLPPILVCHIHILLLLMWHCSLLSVAGILNLLV